MSQVEMFWGRTRTLGSVELACVWALGSLSVPTLLESEGRGSERMACATPLWESGRDGKWPFTGRQGPLVAASVPTPRLGT